MDENTKQAILRLGQGNPGAIQVCVGLFQGYGQEPLVALEELGIIGPEVWYLYNDECGQTYDVMAESLKEGTAIDKLRRNRYSKFFSQ